MAFTIAEALKRTQNPLATGLLKTIATTDELGALISIQPIDGTTVPLDREGTLASAEFIGDSGTTTEESGGTDDVPFVQMRRIVGNFDVDKMAVGVSGYSREERLARLIAKKTKATWRLIKDKLIDGGHTTGSAISPIQPALGDGDGTNDIAGFSAHLDSTRRGPGSIKMVVNSAGADVDLSFRAPGDKAYGAAVNVTADGTVTLKSENPSNWIQIAVDISETGAADLESHVTFASSNNEFDGLFKMADPSQIIPVTSSGTGDAFDIEMLDELIDKVKIRENLAFVVNGRHVIRFLDAQRDLGGASPEHMQLEGYGGRLVAYRGIPMLTNDNLKTYSEGSDTVADIVLVSLSPDEGLVLGAQSTGGEVRAFDVDADPRTQSVFGFRIEMIESLEGKDASRVRVKWYGAPVLQSPLACAIRQGVKTAA